MPPAALAPLGFHPPGEFPPPRPGELPWSSRGAAPAPGRTRLALWAGRRACPSWGAFRGRTLSLLRGQALLANLPLPTRVPRKPSFAWHFPALGFAFKLFLASLSALLAPFLDSASSLLIRCPGSDPRLGRALPKPTSTHTRGGALLMAVRADNREPPSNRCGGSAWRGAQNCLGDHLSWAEIVTKTWTLVVPLAFLLPSEPSPCASQKI